MSPSAVKIVFYLTAKARQTKRKKKPHKTQAPLPLGSIQSSKDLSCLLRPSHRHQRASPSKARATLATVGPLLRNNVRCDGLAREFPYCGCGRAVVAAFTGRCGGRTTSGVSLEGVSTHGLCWSDILFFYNHRRGCLTILFLLP